mmetsp:Transcript_15439/g.43752  ORF Transcript_15439/g.43752 Transcript_15439/m.43752 type:complete len:447 (+) Transcript_15439:86-1426(+)|eukprot:CAMPEP_0119131404 /NCGR_PEP_ID=MMETSP1310-20130426/10300_1 /TAXON_ID=464262 /ORGANISM="Genus nov. species nov., Strain RCC2339" /LENGTH=446 /DNA_ID=CAMNT_0007121977 /DNA_START=67 /DNA_END=1407 /DNA_ORIENTATION=+
MKAAVLTLMLVGLVMSQNADPEKVLQSFVASVEGDMGSELSVETLCNSHGCCNMTTSTSNCSLAEFPQEPSTLVFPGGNTRCIFSTSTPYAFQVWPGASDKILFYFQGGGACWDKSSTVGHLCTTNVYPQGELGVFDRSNPDVNKYADYTIVHLMYCSGDMHIGNVVRPYDDRKGVPVTQRGQANVQATYQWVVDQQLQGNLASTFADVVVMGCSAGSIAAQVWSREILNAVSWTEAAVVPDSYIGVFPPNTQGPLIYDYGGCTTDILPPELQSQCLAQNLTLQTVMEYWMAESPNVPFSYVQSKVDIVQISFYSLLATSTGHNPFIGRSEFYDRVNDIMEGYNVYPEFVTYLVDGPQHCFTNMNLYYDAGPTGPHEGETSGTTMVHDWVNSVPLASGDSIDTVCEGKPRDTTIAVPQNLAENEMFRRVALTYCSTELYPKTYVEP